MSTSTWDESTEHGPRVEHYDEALDMIEAGQRRLTNLGLNVVKLLDALKEIDATDAVQTVSARTINVVDSELLDDREVVVRLSERTQMSIDRMFKDVPTHIEDLTVLQVSIASAQKSLISTRAELVSARAEVANKPATSAVQ